MEEDSKRTNLHKSLRLCLSKKLKKIPPIPRSNITSRRCLSTCRFSRTPSLDIDQAAAAASSDSRDHAATLSDVDRFLFDNFRSLYIHDRDDCTSSAETSASHVNGTQGTAETSSLSESVIEDSVEARAGGQSSNNIAVALFSREPYTDFRRSMKSMIKMHHGQGSQPLDWDFLEELLFYYLQLNDQSVHKYILKAFADLTAGTDKGRPERGKPHCADKSVRSRKS